MDSRLTRGGAALTYSLAIAILIFVLAPLAVVVALSFSEAQFAIFPPQGFTLSWYSTVVTDPEFLHAVGVSIVLALAATVASFALGLPAAWALDRKFAYGKRTVEAILLSPLIFPVLISGLALLKLFAAMRMRDAPVNLFIGHVLITLPYMVRTVTVSLKQVNPSLEEAALTLGGPPWRVFWLVTVPQILPGIAAGCLFSFMVSFDDFPITMWLADAQTLPLPLYLFQVMSRVFDPSIAAMSSLMILIGIVAVAGLEKLVGLRRAMSV